MSRPTPRPIRRALAATIAAAAVSTSFLADRVAQASLGAPTTTVSAVTRRASQAAALPDLPVVDLARGRTVRLRGVATGRPVVLWFWAPG